MKKLIVLVLTLVTVMSCSMVVFAEEGTVGLDVVTFTTTVPETAYTLEIPASQEIPFGTTATEFGKVRISESQGFLLGKTLKLTVLTAGFTKNNKSVHFDYGFFVTDGEERNGQYLFVNDSTRSSEYIFTPSTEGVLNEYVTIDGLELPYWGMDFSLDSWKEAEPGNYEIEFVFETEVIYQ